MFWNNHSNTETEATGPPTSERPDWLNDDADMEDQSGKDWDTADKSPATTTEVSPASTNADKPTAEDKGPWCKRMTIIGISALFAAGFIFASLKGKNVGSKLQWYIYFAISAAIPVFFLCHYILCFPVKIIYTLSVLVACWSVANIIMGALDLGDYPKGDENEKIREEIIKELTGVSAGLFSALYHACASKYFVSTKAKNDE